MKTNPASRTAVENTKIVPSKYRVVCQSLHISRFTAIPTFKGETVRPPSHVGKSLIGIEQIASDREAAPLTTRPSLLSPRARAKNRLLFFSSIGSISRDGSHWIIHKRKQNARNEVKPLELKCHPLSFHKCSLVICQIFKVYIQYIFVNT